MDALYPKAIAQGSDVQSVDLTRFVARFEPHHELRSHTSYGRAIDLARATQCAGRIKLAQLGWAKDSVATCIKDDRMHIDLALVGVSENKVPCG